MTDQAPAIEIGDRYLDLDPRHDGRVVQIIGTASVTGEDDLRYVAEVEVHPTNPEAVGRTTNLKPETLLKRYKRISH